MTGRRQFILVAMVAAAAAAAGYGMNAWRLGAGDGAAEAVMASGFSDLDGRLQPLSQWRGKVLVVNFWATWCTPCREEIPGFVRLQEKYRDRGLQFVGVAIDQPDKVQAFAREFSMNYPVLLGGIDSVEMSRRTGNRAGALPYTLLFDRTGRIVGSELGGLKESKLDGMIQSLL